MDLQKVDLKRPSSETNPEDCKRFKSECKSNVDNITTLNCSYCSGGSAAGGFGCRNSSHNSSSSHWSCLAQCADDDSGNSGDSKNGDKKEDEDSDDVDDGTLAFLRIFAPELYEKITMKRMIKRDIIVDRPDVQWTDIANQVKAKRMLQEAVILPLEKPNYFKNIRKPWKGVLMVGPPGTGKTMLAKAVATEKNITFFNVSVSTLTSKFFGESEKLIKMLFEEAKTRAPSVIFIDEIDSLCSSRGEPTEHEVTRRMKSELLSHMDGLVSASKSDPAKSIVILGASNFPWNIDNAFLRRLEKRIYVPLPDSKGREELLKLTLRNVDVHSDVDLELISDQLDGYSASDIVVVCRDAAFMSMRKAIKGKTVEQIKAIPMAVMKAPITKDDFNLAIKKCQKTVTEADIKKFEEWNEEYGSSV
uniref:Katanin p60 ATPase-containing subunit A1 n=1 Tax=Cacopsylla melanoneura TaxID=428564 RepID=A0A8D8LZH1_9HEMI